MNWGDIVGLLIAAIVLVAVIVWTIAVIGLALGPRDDGIWLARRRKFMIALAASSLIFIAAPYLGFAFLGDQQDKSWWWLLTLLLLLAAILLSALLAWPISVIGLARATRDDGVWRDRRRRLYNMLAAASLILSGAAAATFLPLFDLAEAPVGSAASVQYERGPQARTTPPVGTPLPRLGDQAPSINRPLPSWTEPSPEANGALPEPAEPTTAQPQPAPAPVAAPHAPSDIVFCEALSDEVSLAECEHANKIRDSLKLGNGGIQYPQMLHRGETRQVKFAITVDPKGAPVEGFLGAHPDQLVELKIGRFMAAELDGEGFKIEPSELIHRDLYSGAGARWEWTVTPLNASHYNLELSAYVVASGPDGTQKEMLLKTLELPLNVDVTWSQRLGDFVNDSTGWLATGANWIKTLTAFILAVIGFVAILRGKKGQRA